MLTVKQLEEMKQLTMDKIDRNKLVDIRGGTYFSHDTGCCEINTDLEFLKIFPLPQIKSFTDYIIQFV